MRKNSNNCHLTSFKTKQKEKMAASDDDKDEPFEAQFSIDYNDVNFYYFQTSFFILVYLGKSTKKCQEK